jgi:hypothetical protein
MKRCGWLVVAVFTLSFSLPFPRGATAEEKTAAPEIDQGADSRIVLAIRASALIGIRTKKYIDASSVRTGDYVNAREFRNRTVYVTDEGLALIEKYTEEDIDGAPAVSVERNASAQADWFSGVFEEGIGQRGTDNPGQNPPSPN